MPKTSIDYNNTIIYKIICKDLSITYNYTGHTTDFRKRKTDHKTNCNCEKSKKNDLKLYTTIRENGGWDNWEMIEIEKFPCKDGNEARARERYWYNELSSNMNSRLPYRSSEELKQYNQQYQLQYVEANKEKIKEYKKAYYKKKKSLP